MRLKKNVYSTLVWWEYTDFTYVKLVDSVEDVADFLSS